MLTSSEQDREAVGTKRSRQQLGSNTALRLSALVRTTRPTNTNCKSRAGVFCSAYHTGYHTRAFTLIELVIVITIIGVMLTIFGFRTGTFGFWREEGFLRRLSETMVFLNRQAVVDGSFYRLEFDFEKSQYSVGVMQEASGVTSASAGATAGALGNLSLELNEILSPALGSTQTLIPPPSLPSLAEPVPFPEGVILTRVKTARGTQDAKGDEKPYILFSPRGFSEFAVVHFTVSSGSPVTISINPFTGLAEVFREDKDFNWNYGSKKNDE